MRRGTRGLCHVLTAVILVTLLSGVSRADDRSFSSVVKHIETNYRAKRQGFFGAITFARFLVKLIKPAGVKNFKVVMLRDLDYSSSPRPDSIEFHSFVRSKVHPSWQPLVQYSSKREKQWTYVYVTNEDRDVKLLVVTMQQREALVVQFKFSPEKLIAFMNDPKIMGIRLGDDNDGNRGPDHNGAPKEDPKPKKSDNN